MPTVRAVPALPASPIFLRKGCGRYAAAPEASLAMPTVRGDAGFAGVADLLAEALRPVCHSATQQSLVEDPPAGRARLALDLVRNPASLTQHVGRDRLVAMCFRGSHSGHCSSG
jgi:hypothetical protein